MKECCIDVNELLGKTEAEIRCYVNRAVSHFGKIHHCKIVTISFNGSVEAVKKIINIIT